MKYPYLFRYGFFAITLTGMAIRAIERFFFSSEKRTPLTHSARRKKRLSKLQKSILVNRIDFYQKLDNRHREYFEHRLAIFIRSYDFIGREGYKIDATTKVLLGSSYVMLTFGKQKFITDVFEKIIVYPDVFQPVGKKRKHKGEFNPKYKVVVFSWKHFMEGIEVNDDNLNLGIHEFTHVIHIKSLKKTDISSLVFRRGYQKLINHLQENEHIRKKILASNYFRKYAFENQYEFMAVLIESFIETPDQFKTQFPRIYRRIKGMLNFNFLHY